MHWPPGYLCRHHVMTQRGGGHPPAKQRPGATTPADTCSLQTAHHSSPSSLMWETRGHSETHLNKVWVPGSRLNLHRAAVTHVWEAAFLDRGRSKRGRSGGGGG